MEAAMLGEIKAFFFFPPSSLFCSADFCSLGSDLRLPDSSVEFLFPHLGD